MIDGSCQLAVSWESGFAKYCWICYGVTTSNRAICSSVSVWFQQGCSCSCVSSDRVWRCCTSISWRILFWQSISTSVSFCRKIRVHACMVCWLIDWINMIGFAALFITEASGIHFIYAGVLQRLTQILLEGWAMPYVLMWATMSWMENYTLWDAQLDRWWIHHAPPLLFNVVSTM